DPRGPPASHTGSLTPTSSYRLRDEPDGAHRRRHVVHPHHVGAVLQRSYRGSQRRLESVGHVEGRVRRVGITGDASEERLATDADQDRPAEVAEAVQSGQQLEVVGAGLTEADAGIDPYFPDTGGGC